MSARSAVVRERRSSIVRIARSLHRDRGHAYPAEVAAAAAAVGLKPSPADVQAALARLGMYRR
ncbi:MULTISPECIES: hypothetical protein [Streptomyces]|uniref:Uncharacterized protein n=2 Tax=Streptomyces TaxID=1883 RepID=A0A2U9NZY8_STRAS|nr:hypothetical protein [Streptomyces actuosus]AWT42822.1 hypothetical protein DMT42_11135 [Streptomyces actuosus]MBM4820053.1 hypothetical protein [Streptomyces actuosus]MBM4825065.1 hypothetical protein [Streptomyces actuosus]